MEKYQLCEQFKLFGREMFLMGINNSHSGNMSTCDRERREITITRSGAMLGNIQMKDLVYTTTHENNFTDKIASRELIVHRAIYSATKKTAIIHSHPTSVIAVSLKNDFIKPIDVEGSYYFPDGVKVISAQTAVASAEVAAKIAPLLETEKIVVVRGHGTFAACATLEECFLYTTTLEFACRTLINYINLSRNGN
ncbi:MAG TPA: class II aldolase/adducin family protein [Candidatus Wallbacteria bacterium]|nr:class II aldolase/adducin family protein [Candidatus Wallbacteria bacterium]